MFGGRKQAASPWTVVQKDIGLAVILASCHELSTTSEAIFLFGEI